MEEQMVEILGGKAGESGRYLDGVYNEITGEYYGPLLSPEKKREIESLRELINSKKQGDSNLPKIHCAIIDTGVLSNHPLIIPHLMEESVDFTGEGPEDQNGHGTVVSLIYLANATADATIYNVKALDSKGRGTMDNLIKAIDWCIERKIKLINISAGINYKKFGLFDCNGTCKLCKAAERAVNNGSMVFAAAGNEANETYCPATAGVKRGVGIWAMGAVDLDNKKLPDSGTGNFYALGTVNFGPIQ